ncbi:MAG: hypothetical protein WDZ52_10165 [Pseudohongiellaceae bacterium]
MISRSEKRTIREHNESIHTNLGLFKYSSLYDGAQAELIEGDIFKINVPLTPEVRNRNILEFCSQPRSMTEIMTYTGLKDREHFRTEILKPLIDQGLLQLTQPGKPASRLQRYVTTENRKKVDSP